MNATTNNKWINIIAPLTLSKTIDCSEIKNVSSRLVDARNWNMDNSKYFKWATFIAVETNLLQYQNIRSFCSIN